MKIMLLTSIERVSVVWANARVFDELWDPECHNHIAVWDGEPCESWFRPKGTKDRFIVPVMSLVSRNDRWNFSFANGKHRTRWMISNMKCEEIPIALEESQIELGESLGLVLRTVNSDDEFLS